MEPLIKAAVDGIPLLLVVFMLVELAKRLEREDGTPLLQGNAILLSSLGIGLVLGIGYMLYSVPPEPTYRYWFSVVIFGLTLGGLASIFYDLLKTLVERWLPKG